MTCPLPRCIAPQCKGRTWIATGAGKSNVEAFAADVREHMKQTGQLFGKSCAAVFKKAQAESCMFE